MLKVDPLETRKMALECVFRAMVEQGVDLALLMNRLNSGVMDSASDYAQNVTTTYKTAVLEEIDQAAATVGFSKS